MEFRDDAQYAEQGMGDNVSDDSFQAHVSNSDDDDLRTQKDDRPVITKVPQNGFNMDVVKYL